ncbi:putative tubulin--tyrosine ligase pby1 [Balamuthia mandrillaris]
MKKGKQPARKRAKPDPKESKKEQEEHEAEAEEKNGEGILFTLAALSEELPETPNTSVGGAAPSLPPVPGLVVKGRAIPLPLSLADAPFLHDNGKVSPHGRGMETVVDTRVRSSKEFNPTDFYFVNPQWKAGVESLTEEVAKQLGATGCKVEARPYKLLLYSQGDHFLPHRDTEKEKGMFATLIVQLPSRCQGGALVVSQGGVRQTYDFGESSGMAAFQCHFAGHYADVEHEVREVTSGHRLAVVYNLVWANPNLPRPKSEPFQRSVEAFAKALKRWKDVPNDMVVLLLEHLYTEEGLLGKGLAAMKGKDRVLASILRAANSLLDAQQRVSLFIATVDRTENFEADYDGHWRWEDSNEKIHWYSAVGQPAEFNQKHLRINWETDVASTKPLKEKHIFSFEGKTEEEEYTGNESATMSTTYHRSVLVLWPEVTEIQLAMRRGGLYSAAVCAHAALDNKEAQLQKVDQVLELWKSNPDLASKSSWDYGSTEDGAALLLQCLASGDCVRLNRVLDLLQAMKPSNKLDALSKQLALFITNEQCAASKRLFQAVKKTAVSWMKHHRSGIKAAATLLEAVVQANATPARALQLMDAIAQALTEVKEGLTYGKKLSNDEQVASLQRTLKLLIEKWDWTDIGQHVMALLHAAPSVLTLHHRLSLAQSLSAPLAFSAIAQDAIDDVLQANKGKESLDLLYVPALVLCAALDDLERGKHVCDLIGFGKAIRKLEDTSLFGGWPFFCEELAVTVLMGPRIQQLEELVAKGPPEFNWVQRPKRSKVKVGMLLTFLKSTEATTTITGFGSIAAARRFVDKYQTGTPRRNGYSAYFEAGGQGASSRVTVQKTKLFHQHLLKVYKRNCEELEALRARFAEYEKTKKKRNEEAKQRKEEAERTKKKKNVEPDDEKELTTAKQKKEGEASAQSPKGKDKKPTTTTMKPPAQGRRLAKRTRKGKIARPSGASPSKGGNAYVREDSEYVRRFLRKAFEQRADRWQVIWGDEQQPAKEEPSLLPEGVCFQWDTHDRLRFERVLKGSLLVNSYCVTKGLTRKAQLCRFANKYAFKKPRSALALAFPRTEVVDADPNDLAWCMMDVQEAMQEEQEEGEEATMPPKHEKGEGLWILKASVVNKAEGVNIVRTPNQVRNLLQKWPEVREWVLQRYIERPLLVDGRKFHLRAYVLAVGTRKVFLHGDMLALFAGRAYTLPSSQQQQQQQQQQITPKEEEKAEEEKIEEGEETGKRKGRKGRKGRKDRRREGRERQQNIVDAIDRLAHLTNTALQAQQPDFQEERCVKTLSELEKDIGPQLCSSIFAQCCRVVEDTFRAVFREFGAFMALPNCFELFGYDFLVDEKGKVWLLEINAGPDFKQTGSRLDYIIQSVMEGALQHGLDPYFEEKEEKGEDATRESKQEEKVEEEDEAYSLCPAEDAPYTGGGFHQVLDFKAPSWGTPSMHIVDE